jgi:hypothetical protein
MEVSDLQSAQMMVDCQRVQPSSKNSTGGLTSQSDSSKGGKKTNFGLFVQYGQLSRPSLPQL